MEETRAQAKSWNMPNEKYHAHFDCFSGAAGDMMLAACFDTCNDAEEMERLRCHVTKCIALGLPELADEFRIETKRVWRGGMGSIAALHVNVVSKYNHEAAPVPKKATTAMNDTERKEDSSTSSQATHEHSHDHGSKHHHEHIHEHKHEHHHEHIHDHSHSNLDENSDQTQGSNPKTDDDRVGDDSSQDNFHSHGHEHSHNHGHTHNHGHSHNHGQKHSHSHDHGSTAEKGRGPLRNLPEIQSMLENAVECHIAPWVKRMAISAFTELAKAEAKTHGAESIQSVHFHEVGAVDSIVDTVGTLIALYSLGVTSVSCSRLPIGEGNVWTDHGLLPVPAPATLRLLVGMPVCPGPPGVTGELVTPTGAAMLRALTMESKIALGGIEGRPPNFILKKIGIGAGSKEFQKHPNIVRLLLGDSIVTK